MTDIDSVSFPFSCLRQGQVVIFVFSVLPHLHTQTDLFFCFLYKCMTGRFTLQTLLHLCTFNGLKREFVRHLPKI